MATTYRGTVKDGVVVMPADIALPEGSEVEVVVPEPGPADEPVGIWKKLADLGRWAETQPMDLPHDLAENHDHSLHCRPKRS